MKFSAVEDDADRTEKLNAAAVSSAQAQGESKEDIKEAAEEKFIELDHFNSNPCMLTYMKIIELMNVRLIP